MKKFIPKLSVVNDKFSATNRVNFLLIGDEASTYSARICTAGQMAEALQIGGTCRSTASLISKGSAWKKNLQRLTGMTSIRSMTKGKAGSSYEDEDPLGVGVGIRFSGVQCEEINASEYNPSDRAFIYVNLGPSGHVAHVNISIIQGHMGGVPTMSCAKDVEDTVFCFLADNIDEVDLNQWQKRLAEITRSVENFGMNDQLGSPTVTVLRQGPVILNKDESREPLMANADDPLNSFYQQMPSCARVQDRSNKVPAEYLTDFQDINTLMAAITAIVRLASDCKPRKSNMRASVAAAAENVSRGCRCSCCCSVNVTDVSEPAKTAW